MVDCAEIAATVSPKDWLAVGVSLASLYISFFTYSRATPKLMLEMYLSQIYSVGDKRRSDDRYLFIQVVNLSIRPVTITNLGLHYHSKLLRILRNRIPWLEKPRGGVWQDVQPLLFDDGKPRVLKDGERITHQILLKPNEGSSTTSWDNIKSVWVSDATGREHYLSKRALRKIKTDFRNASNLY